MSDEHNEPGDTAMSPGELLLGAAAANPTPIFDDPMQLLAFAQTAKLEDRSDLAEAYLRMASKESPLKRDQLVNFGREVFKYTVATAREHITKISANRPLPQVLIAIARLPKKPEM